MKIAKKIKNDSYRIDFIKNYKRNRSHIYKSNIDSYEVTIKRDINGNIIYVSKSPKLFGIF